jgi:hypothetical protein
MNVGTVARTPYERLLLEFAPRAVRSRTQYQRVLRQIDRLMRKAKLTRAEDDSDQRPAADPRRAAVTKPPFKVCRPFSKPTK